MISVAYKTSPEMFCDVTAFFTFFESMCFDGRHFGDFIYLMKNCLLAKKINILEY